MTLFFGVCTFVCVIMSVIGCVTKVEIEEKYNKAYARVLYDELKHGNISFTMYESLIKELDIEIYRIDGKQVGNVVDAFDGWDQAVRNLTDTEIGILNQTAEDIATRQKTFDSGGVVAVAGINDGIKIRNIQESTVLTEDYLKMKQKIEEAR